MSSITSLVLFLALLSTLLGRLLQHKKRIVLSNLSDIVALLDPPGSSISELLQARARPNTRLVHSFGLQNTFVSADSMVRKQFVARAQEILRQHTRYLADFPDVVRGIVAGSARRLRSPPCRPPISFAIFIQVVTVRVVIESLLGGNIPEDSDGGTVFVVEAISDLWTFSKKYHDGVAPPQVATLLESLNTYLRTWIPERYERPLDFVIPAYETMWRVVAVTVARAVHDRGACAAFSAFLESPREDQYVRFEDAQPSVEAFICEVLRLHPPSRRLARAAPSGLGFQFSLWEHATTHVANIEALHQDTGIWGSDAGVFDPMRFHQSRLSHGQKQAFMPFSYGRLRCVAFKEAPRFAAIVAAAVLEIVNSPEAKYRLVCGERLGRREGWEGWSIEVHN
ncbi:cytochrome P450 [Lactarius akahatsu]|uniref:Cytochrome P450 n=1 Tax=Lactarius akahatsu TaxID=416441 RepID=A0AAD4LII5_9AGAM|nr:cytochrome P450 [Lactarius akahatsu]